VGPAAIEIGGGHGLANVTLHSGTDDGLRKRFRAERAKSRADRPNCTFTAI
jgi:hypothetical protein